MKKKSLLRAIALLVVMVSSQVVRAAGSETCLAVTETSGAITYFALSADPSITFENDEMTVMTESEGSLTVAIDDVVRYNFVEEVASMIGRTVATEGGSTVFSSGMAYVPGLKAGESVYVYTADGQQVSSTAASSNGEACVNLSGLKASTVYILRTPSASYKIVNK